jgi:hypothetical protein
MMKPTRCKHWVEQEDPSIGDILGELVVKQLGLGRLLVPLDQDLANPHGPAALAQALLHGLARAHDGHAADLALEGEAIIGAPDRRRDRVLDGRQVVQALLDQETDNAVGVEDEVSALRLLVADDSAAGVSGPRAISGRPRRETTHESSAISCGVCGRMVTVSNSTPVETTAVGFWLSER